MQFRFHRRERLDLVQSWLVISAAFAIVMLGGVAGLRTDILTILITLIVAAVTVGVGFIFHELAHKWAANRFNCHAEYKSDKAMLLVAIITSLFGIVVAAPGAVHVSGHPNPRQKGMTAMAGPIANLVAAALFLVLFFTLEGFWATAAGFGAVINTWLGLFNMIPFGAFDGAKVFAWNKVTYGIIVAVAILLAFIQVPLGLF